MVSRQRRYQVKHKAEGRCSHCASAVAPPSTVYCLTHGVTALTRRARKVNGNFSAAFWSRLLKQFL